jgi:DNA-binding response OmpR family regulator
MSTEPAKILLVEDDDQSAKVVLLTIQRAGLSAVHVDSGSKAIEYLDRERPDVIVLDLSLPQINGWQVLDHAQSKYGTNSIKVIVTTARHDAANQIVGKLRLVTKYLVKPYDPDQLTAALKNILANEA